VGDAGGLDKEAEADIRVMKYRTIAVLTILFFTAFLAWGIKTNAPPTWQVIFLIGAWVSLAMVMMFDAGEIDRGKNVAE